MKNLDIWLTNFLLSIGMWGYVLSCFLILIESIVPALPLSIFITLLFYKFGVFIGFIISYVFTILGCIMSYKIFNSKLRYKLDNYINKNDMVKLNKLKMRINKINFNSLCLIIAIPFTPAFLINIAAGLTNMNFKKYLYALMIGKIFLIIFWGFIGTSLINSFKNPINLVYIIVLLIICFIISKLVSKREGLE